MTENNPEITYSPIPLEISQIIFGDEETHTTPNVQGCNLFDVIVKILSESEDKAKEYELSTVRGLDTGIHGPFYYMESWWEECEGTPFNLKFKDIQKNMRKFLIGEWSDFLSDVSFVNFLLYANYYYKGTREEKSINTEFLIKLRNDLTKTTENNTKEGTKQMNNEKMGLVEKLYYDYMETDEYVKEVKKSNREIEYNEACNLLPDFIDNLTGVHSEGERNGFLLGFKYAMHLRDACNA